GGEGAGRPAGAEAPGVEHRREEREVGLDEVGPARRAGRRILGAGGDSGRQSGARPTGEGCDGSDDDSGCDARSSAHGHTLLLNSATIPLMPRLGVSWWHDRASSARRPRYPVCRGELEADVVVIGGGLTGAVAACVLARGGLDVVLVEAGRLAEGQTAAGLGCLVSDPAPSFVTTTAATGLRTAKAAWRVARTSARELAAAIRRLKIRCDLTATTLVTGAADLTQVTALRREQAAR